MLRKIKSIKEIRQLRNSKEGSEESIAYFYLSNAGVDQESLREYKGCFNTRNQFPYECSYLIRIEWKDSEYNVWVSQMLILPNKPDEKFIEGLKQTYKHSHITCYPLSKVEFSYNYQESIIVDK